MNPSIMKEGTKKKKIQKENNIANTQLIRKRIINNFFFFFGETNTHTRERKMSSNTKAHHNPTQKI